MHIMLLLLLLVVALIIVGVVAFILTQLHRLAHRRD